MSGGAVMDVIQTEENLFKALDKGIEDMENGNVYDYEDAMAMVRQRLKDYVIQKEGNR